MPTFLLLGGSVVHVLQQSCVAVMVSPRIWRELALRIRVRVVCRRTRALVHLLEIGRIDGRLLAVVRHPCMVLDLLLPLEWSIPVDYINNKYLYYQYNLITEVS